MIGRTARRPSPPPINDLRLIAFAMALMSIGVTARFGWGQERLPAVRRTTQLPPVVPTKPVVPEVPVVVEQDAPAGEEPLAPFDWWSERAADSVLDRPRWVRFDLPTVLLDTINSSPRIKTVSRRTSVALEQIVEQDAAFDASLLLDERVGRTNDRVGNSLATGGPPRLIEESFSSLAGVKQTGRRGTELNMSQELGLLDSNSLFFDPANQGNARLSVSLTQPLLERGGRVYNERLLTSARIDSRVVWQDMRAEVEQRIADVMTAYWKLHELRCHLVQQQALLDRGRRIEKIVEARDEFDASRIELAKARQRVARRVDRQVQIAAEIAKQQVKLATLVGSETLAETGSEVEMIPSFASAFPDVEIQLRDAVVRGIENRPEVRAAMEELESAALGIRVTRAELLPELTAVVDGYLMGLNGSRDMFKSFTDQFTRGGPGFSAGFQYELPVGRRAARSRHRAAHYRYQQKSEQVRESIQLTRAEIESAMIGIRTAVEQRRTKRELLLAAIEEETVLTRRWEMMAGDGAAVGTVLETLLDAQQRRTDAEREWTSVEVRYRAALVELQRAMGTLLTQEGIEPVQLCGDNSVEFLKTTNTESKLEPAASSSPASSFEMITSEGTDP